MGHGLLALLGARRRETIRLGGARYTLRILPAWEVLCARREAARLAAEDAEGALCGNACLLARALVKRNGTGFPDGKAVLQAFSAEEIAALTARYAQLGREENPSAEGPEQETKALKKAWSTRRTSA